MTTVFIKFLETRPANYDRGVHILTLEWVEEMAAGR